MMDCNYSPEGEKLRRILIISLERANERMIKMGEQMGKIADSGLFTFSFVAAVDGKEIPKEYLKRISLPGGYREGEYFKPGEMGCTLSHIKALETAKYYGFDEVIILEDDVILADDFAKRIRILFGIIPSDWEHIYLSGIPRLGFNPPPQLQFPNVVRSIFTECTHSMVIRNTAYDKIINYLKLFETTTDDSYNQLIMNGLRSYTYYPFCTYANDTYTYIWNHEINREHKSKLYFKNKL